jgi:glycosyltransferase involved in cell wall biosynthesis
MRILQVFNRYRDRGGEQEWVERLPALVDERSVVETLQFDSRDWLESGSPARLRQSWLIGNNPHARQELAGAAKRFKPDILLFHNLIPVASLGLYDEAARLGLPVVQYLHNYRPFSVSGYLWANGKVDDAALHGNPWPEIRSGAWNGSMAKTAILSFHLARLKRSGALDSVRLWIAVSDFVRGKMLEAGMPADRVVSLRHCWPSGGAIPEMQESDYYFFIGHLCPEKGVTDLLEAWRMLEARFGPECPSLVIAGSGPLEKMVLEECARNQRIRYAGHVSGEAKNNLLAGCRALLAPSAWWEPLGLIVYEAYEHGRPVIASLSGGLAETVQPGITGLSHLPSNPGDLAAAVMKMEDLGPQARTKMGIAGNQWVRNHCTPAQWNDQFHKIIESIRPLGNQRVSVQPARDPLKISVVTACYNQSSTIERTIRSIVGQGYPNLEYIIVDGASKDNTMDIVRNFDSKISKIISEPDDGQYHAIQKGLNLASGDIMAWLNGDDIYFPWTFRLVDKIFTRFPDVDWIMGLPTFTNEDDVVVKLSTQMAGYPRQWIANGWYSESFGGFLQQESMFWRKSLWDKSPKLDLSLGLAADFKLWTDFAKLTDLVAVSVPIGSFRDLPDVQRSVVMRDTYFSEVESVTQDLPQPNLLWRTIAPRGLVARSFCRSVLRAKARGVVYSRHQRDWKLVETRLPISRASMNDLVLEYHMSRR